MLGKSGIQASVIGLGSWIDEEWLGGSPDEHNLIETITAALDNDINFIDTAPLYGLGFAEEMIGKAIRGKRDQVVLADKCGLVWDIDQGRYAFDYMGKKVNRSLNEQSIRREFEQSLHRLGTDYIDLYQIHVFDPDHPMEESIQTLLSLKQEGKIRAIGICSPSMAQLEVWHRDSELDIVQQPYSMADRRAELDIIPYCFNHGISVVAWSPLIQGLLTGKIGPNQKYAPDSFEGLSVRFNSEKLQEAAYRISEFNPIAHRYGIDLTQLVLAWTIQSAGVTHVLVGVTDAQRINEIARAGNVSLSQDEVGRINAIIESGLEDTTEAWSL
jgi:aryl-alcohol dehydrogenase-like predicted oxidoreductase